MLILIRGLPGSGKTTFAKKHFPGYVRVEADDYFYNTYDEYEFDASKLAQAHKQCKIRVTAALLHGADVVVSNTFTTKKEIQPYLDMGKTLGRRVQVITLENDYGSVHNIPKKTFEKMKARFELL